MSERQNGLKLSNNTVAKNTVALMIMNVAKILLPLVTLPYLTRVLSKETYGDVTYVKAVMSYMQTIVDFGFILSATKHIVAAKGDKEKIGVIVGDNTLSKILIALVGGIALSILIIFIPLLRANALYTVLSYINVCLSIFLFDFFFRGIEKMEIITYRYFAMKLISTLLTFLLVKNDSDVILIPIIDFVGSIVAVFLVLRQLAKEKIKIRFSGIKTSLAYIRESFTYFLSNMASTSFNAFNTVIMGICLSKTDVAYWGICVQIISAVQLMFTPMSDALFPEMVRNRSKSVFYRALKLYIPITLLCSIIAYFMAPFGMLLVGGSKYMPAVSLFRGLIPIIFFGFLSIIFGWPSLGAIGRVREVTMTTVIAISFQIISILIAVGLGKLNLIVIAVIRNITELLLFCVRFYYYRKYIKEFN